MVHRSGVSHPAPPWPVLAACGFVIAVVGCSPNHQATAPSVPLASTPPTSPAPSPTSLGAIRDPSLVDVAERTGASSTAFGIGLPSAGPLTVSLACSGGGSVSVAVGNFENTVPCSGEPSTDQFAMTAGQFVVHVQAHDQRWRLLLQRRP